MLSKKVGKQLLLYNNKFQKSVSFHLTNFNAVCNVIAVISIETINPNNSLGKLSILLKNGAMTPKVTHARTKLL